MKVLDMNKTRAEQAGREFARSRRLSVEDPIVKRLVTGIKMALGKRSYLDRLAAEKDYLQPSLFAPEVKSPVSIAAAATQGRQEPA